MFKFAVFAIFFAAHVVKIQGCHAVANHDSRRKRAADDDVGLRQFFDSCMAEQYGGGSFITEVDWVILDSIWYDDVASTNCNVNDQDDAECWKNNLDDLVADGPLGGAIKSCIDQYEEQENGLFRRKRRSVSRNILEESEGPFPTTIYPSYPAKTTTQPFETFTDTIDIELWKRAFPLWRPDEPWNPEEQIFTTKEIYNEDFKMAEIIPEKDELPTQSCPIEKGFCVKTDGGDQNSGVKKLNGIDGDSLVVQQDCLNKCKDIPHATGCEVIWDQSNRGCYAHTQPIARGNNVGNHMCWVFSKCNGRDRRSRRYYKRSKEYSRVYPSSPEEIMEQGQFADGIRNNADIRERGLGRYDYQRLSAFVQTQTIERSCNNRKREGLVQDWQARFVDWTKPRSDLYEAIRTTASQQAQVAEPCKLPGRKDVAASKRMNYYNGVVGTAYAVAVQGVVGYCDPEKDEWTPWDNRDRPSGSGDWETRRDDRHRGTCASEDAAPKAIQARLVKDQQPYTTSGETVTISPGFGFVCRNRDQGDKYCEDYEVRYCCPRKIIG